MFVCVIRVYVHNAIPLRIHRGLGATMDVGATAAVHDDGHRYIHYLVTILITYATDDDLCPYFYPFVAVLPAILLGGYLFVQLVHILRTFRTHKGPKR